MADLTYNLRNWLNELRSIRTRVAPAVLMDVINDYKDDAHDILWEEAETALQSTGEYNIAAFKNPLKKAIYDWNTIQIVLDSYGSDEINIYIDLDATAGNISDYAKAVRAARSILTEGNKPITKKQASFYWKNIIYGAGVGEDDSEDENESGMYLNTIKTRLGQTDSPAPFWSIINDGNASVDELDEGGFPYPKFGPTRFVKSAKAKIEKYIGNIFRKELDSMYKRLEQEEYGGRHILDNLESTIAEFETFSVSRVDPGDVLRYIEIRGRQYQLYVTGTSKLGLRLT